MLSDVVSSLATCFLYVDIRLLPKQVLLRKKNKLMIISLDVEEI